LVLSALNQAAPSTATWILTRRARERASLVTHTLQDLLQQLGEERFARIHKSAAANVSQIAALERMPKGDYEVRLRSGARLRLSRRYASALLMKSSG
jgi:two-component system LytT family response regulator